VVPAGGGANEVLIGRGNGAGDDTNRCILRNTLFNSIQFILYSLISQMTHF